MIFTAALIEGWVLVCGRAIPFRISVGKGLAKVQKRLVFRDGGDDELVVSLCESGWQAHYRLLRELVAASHPDLRLTLADAVSVIRLCARACELAVDEGSYPFGTMPDFLRPTDEVQPRRSPHPATAAVAVVRVDAA
jgi:hypothetical protein